MNLIRFDRLMDAAWCPTNALTSHQRQRSCAPYPSHPSQGRDLFETAGGVASLFDRLSGSHGDARQMPPAAKHFDGDAGLRPALNVARRVQAARGVTAPTVALGCVEKLAGRAVIATTEGPHSPEQKHSNRPVENYFPSTQGDI